MTEKQLKDQIKAPSGGYFFYGDEDYLKNYYMLQMRRAVITDESISVFNEVILDDETFNAASLYEAVSAPSLMSPQKFVRVRLSSYSAISEKERRALAEVYAEMKNYPESVVVISVAPDGFDAGTEKKPSAQLKAIEKHLNCVSFPLQTEAKLMQWLNRHFSRDSLAADPAALSLMIQMSGRGMHRLLGEAEKVSAAALAKGLRAVDVELIRSTVTSSPEEDAFKLANAIISGDKEAAFECLAGAKRRNESPVKILASVTASFCDMAGVAHMMAEGADKRTIAAALKLHEYRTGLYMKAAAGVPTEVLDRAVALCAEADVKMKSTPLGFVPLERLICVAGKRITGNPALPKG